MSALLPIGRKADKKKVVKQIKKYIRRIPLAWNPPLALLLFAAFFYPADDVSSAQKNGHKKEKEKYLPRQGLIFFGSPQRFDI